MASSSGRKAVATGIGLLLAVAGVGFVIGSIHREWQSIVAAAAGADPGWMGLALLSAALGMVAIGLGWWRTLSAVGVQTGALPALSWYFVGQMGKYVPGGIWPVVGRGELASRGPVGRGRGYGAVLLSVGVTYLAALLLLALLLPLDPTGLRRIWSVALVILLLPVGFALLHPRVFTWILTTLRSGLGWDLKLIVPGWGTSAALVGLHVPAWILVGIANWCVAVALLGPVPLADVMFAAVLAWVVGFLAFPVPGGIGVREAVFTLAATSLSGGMAAAVAVVSRAVFMGVDALGAVLFLGATVGKERDATGTSPPSPEESPFAPPGDS